MARYKILAPVAAPSSDSEGRYALKLESLHGLSVEFIEC